MRRILLVVLLLASTESGHCSGWRSLAWGGTWPAHTQQAVAAEPGYIYAVGHITPGAPTPQIATDLAQALTSGTPAGKPETGQLFATLSQPQHRELTRRLCWMLSQHETPLYLIESRLPSGNEAFLPMLRPDATGLTFIVIVGRQQEGQTKEPCAGVVAPLVHVDTVSTVNAATLLKELPRPETLNARQFALMAKEVFRQTFEQLTSNAGVTAAERALNHLAVTSPTLYAMSVHAHLRGLTLAASIPHLQEMGTHQMVDIELVYTANQPTRVERYTARVDVTFAQPVVVTPLARAAEPGAASESTH